MMNDKDTVTIVHPLKIRNMKDDQFTVDFRVAIEKLDSQGFPWGAKVNIEKVRIDYLDRKVAKAKVIQPLIILRNAKRLESDNLTAIVTITDGQGFGQIVNSLITTDEVMVRLSMQVHLRPDYFVPLPSFSLLIDVPIEGFPVMLRKNGKEFTKLPFVDIISGTPGWLHLQSKLPIGGIDFGLDVFDGGKGREKVAEVSILNTGIVSVMVPRMNKSIMKLLRNEPNTTLKIVGVPNRTSTVFKPIATELSASISIPPNLNAKPPNLVDGIRITSLFGGSETTVSNPFSVDITMQTIHEMLIYHNDHQIAKINEADVQATLKAHTSHQSIKVNSGKFRFTGGLKGAMKLVQEIRKNGYIIASMNGTVTVSIGEYEIERLPVQMDSVRITY